MTALGSLAIHMFLPAMPAAAAALGTGPSGVQLALTLYMAGLALGQLVSGPIADRAGRRPAMLGGVALFVAGSTLCWAAPSIGMLLAGRVVQALGASSSLVAGRAMIGDAPPGRATRDMALVSAIILLSPMLSPVLGAWIALAAGWRAIFGTLAAAGLVFGIGILRALPETSPPGAGRRAPVREDWAATLRDRAFRSHLTIAMLLSGGLYVFLAASPFLLLERYGVAAGALGWCYGAIAAGAATGAIVASRLAARLPRGRVLWLAALASLAATLALLAGVLLGLHHVAALLGPMIAYAFGSGVVMPNAMIGALDNLRTRAGTAVSLYGATQMGGSALATVVVALLPSHDPLLPALLMAGMAAAAAAVVRGGRSPGGPA